MRRYIVAVTIFFNCLSLFSENRYILIIVAPKDFRDEELFVPKAIFERNQYAVDIASRGVKLAKGLLGKKVKVDYSLDKINIDKYAAVILVGGQGVITYLHDETLLALIKDAYDKGKIIAAIGIAPLVLAYAGILNGGVATISLEKAEGLTERGVTYRYAAVMVSGRIVTANGPDSAGKFAYQIIAELQP